MDGNESSNEIDNSPNSNPEGNEQGNSDKVNTSDESIQNNTGNNTTINNKNNADNNINNLKAIQKIIELERRGYDEKRERYIQDREGFIKEKIINLIRKLATNHSGTTEKYGGTLYDKKKIAEHLLTHQRHKIIDDKLDKVEAKDVLFFIDTSGSLGIIGDLMREIVVLLEKQGYKCTLVACGNGFYSQDAYDDSYYGTRKTLESFEAGKVAQICCPTAETAAKMASNSEFSIIISDFDGLTSICKMAHLCPKDKVPYFLCTEDRYPWEKPTCHDWVDPSQSFDYPKSRIFDVSIHGNPSLQQYYEMGDSYDSNQYYDNPLDDLESRDRVI